MALQQRKTTQRERLLSGVVQAANRGGYAGATVSAVIAAAGVSRPTFYDYFFDRDAAFAAAIEDVQRELLEPVTAALAAAAPEDALPVAVEAIVAYAREQPERARFLMAESMGGGAGAMDVRDRGIVRIAAAIDKAQGKAPAAASVPDVPAGVVVGAVQRMLATRLRRGEAASSALGDELAGWVERYRRPARAARWQKLRAWPVPPPSPHLPDVPIQRMPGLLPPGRPRLTPEQTAEIHRLRILYAAARLAEEKGYIATTVSDITRTASVDGRVFYRHFADKQETFALVHELGFQQVMDVTAKAFFAGTGWLQRSWDAGAALTQLLHANPLVARVGFVEAYAVGPTAVQRLEDSHGAFMFFLQEGLLQAPAADAPTRTAMEAIIDAVFEVIYLQARRSRPQIAGMLAPIAQLWMTPFVGIDAAEAYIDKQAGAAAPSTNAKRGR